MKLATTILATVFATAAFAQAPAKKEEAKPAAPAAAPAAPAKKEEAKPAAPAKKDDKKPEAKK